MKNYVREGQKLPLFGVGPYIVYGMAAVTIAGIILCAYILKIGNLDGPWILTFRIIGGILIVLGLVIWYIGALRSGMDEHNAENRLKTDGIYAWVRNPMYSGWWMILSGIGLMWHNAALLMTIPKLQRSFKPQLGNHDRRTDKHGGEVAAQSVRTGVPGLLQTGQPLPANDTKKEGGATMKKYEPKALVAVSRYQNYFPSLPTELRRDIYASMDELLIEEKAYCDKGNYAHMAQIITSIALYEVLQKHGKSEQEAYRIVSEEMWKFLDPAPMQKLARKRFFLPLMKKIVPLGFRKGSGYGWRYTWHKDDPKDEFRFECNECIYQKILGKRGLMKLGAMCCHADIINYGNLTVKERLWEKEAFSVIEDAAVKLTAGLAQKLAGLMRLPGMRGLFIRIWDPMTRRIFGPDNGFKNRFYPKAKGEYRMDILACPYCRYFTELGCPELTRIFCENDERMYGNLPGLSFERKATGYHTKCNTIPKRETTQLNSGRM